jgi:hypothetical protein
MASRMTATISMISTVLARPEENVSLNPKIPTVRARMKPTMVPAMSARLPSTMISHRVASSATAASSAATTWTRNSTSSVFTCR